MIGQTVSHYKIIERLGGGSMGVVYKAEDTRLGRLVAIKFIPESVVADESALLRFRREARTASALDHPGICMVHDIGQHQGRPFIVMQYLQGASLKSLVQEGALDCPTTLTLAIQAAEALNAAHFHGVIHRDIKPANIFVTESGSAKIVDFGLAKLIEKSKAASPSNVSTYESNRLTTPGTAMGTVAYMSPEQALGEELDHRTDIFSLGITIYEMATGRLPFEGVTSAALFDQIFHSAPEVPSHLSVDLPRQIDAIILKAIEKEKHLRYQSAEAMAQDLRALKLQIDSNKLIVLNPKDSGKGSEKTRTPLVYISLFLFILLVGYFGFWLWTRPDDPIPDPITTLAGVPESSTGAATEYLLLDRGMHLLNSSAPLHPEQALYAVDAFDNAIKVSPELALAYLWKGKAYWRYGRYTGKREAFTKASSAIEKAVELDNSMAEAYRWKARLLVHHERNWTKAEEEYLTATKIDPELTPHAEFFLWQGRLKESVEAIARDMEAAGRHLAQSHCEAAWAYFFAGEFERALLEAEAARELDRNTPRAFWVSGYCYKRKGVDWHIAAARNFQRALRLEGQLTGVREDTLNREFELNGLRGFQRALLNLCSDGLTAYHRAAIAAELNDLEGAFRLLEGLLRNPATGALEGPFVVDPRFATLRSDARWESLLQALAKGS